MFKGRASIRVCLAYITRLSIEPWSEWRAEQLGGSEHLGWSPDTYRAADLIDAVNQLTIVTQYHGSQKQPPTPDPYYRPGRKEEDKPKQSLADFDIRALVAMTGAG